MRWSWHPHGSVPLAGGGTLSFANIRILFRKLNSHSQSLAISKRLGILYTRNNGTMRATQLPSNLVNVTADRRSEDWRSQRCWYIEKSRIRSVVTYVLRMYIYQTI